MSKTKKIYSMLLASAMMAQPCVTAFAATEDNTEANGGLGTLNLSINMELPSRNKVFSVSLDGDSGKKTGTMQADKEGKQGVLSIQDIVAGEYTLNISADGFIQYSQPVVIKNNTTTVIELHNSQAVNAGMESRSKKHGVMAIGDLTGDGKVDDADAEAMMTAIDNSSTEPKYDLNGDGKVDAADLVYVTMNYGSNVQATPLSILDSSSITPKSDCVKDGDIADLTEKTESFVRFQPKNKEKISTENPVELSLDVAAQENATTPTVDGIVIKAPAGSDNLIKEGKIVIETEDGPIEAVIVSNPESVNVARFGRTATVATIESDGSIVVNLGQQVAVKKVTITVTGSTGSNLVDISQVQFVNGMENRIPAPDLNIPVNVQLAQLSAGLDPSFSVSWDSAINVTGYEVEVEGNGKTAVFSTTDNKCRVMNIAGSKIQTNVPYKVRVRSTNGEWKSPYSEDHTITLTPESVPSAPENVTVKGEVESISVSWKKMSHTTSYSIFYKEKDSEGTFREIPNIQDTHYTISGLTAGTAYQVYVVGHNSLGASPNSIVNIATPVSSSLVKMPKYGLINTDEGVGKPSAHIQSVKIPGGTVNHGGEFSVVDNDPSTYTQLVDWDSGVHYANYANPIVTLDDMYPVQFIRFAIHDSQKNDLKTEEAAVRYYDNETNQMKKIRCHLIRKKDEKGKSYYEIRFPEPVTSNQFQLCLVTVANAKNITISEMKFYGYDDLTKRINELYIDNLHLALRSDVTREMIEGLKKEVDTEDPICHEYHPDRVGLHKELDNALALLAQQSLGNVISVNTKIAPNADNHLDFGNLSNYQPIGKIAKAGESLIVYVGSAGKREGEKTDLKLVSSQHHAEASAWANEIPLHVGRNEITIPNITNRENENGGSLYLAWNGDSNTEDKYSIRVSGGTDIPMLDVSGKDESEMRTTIEDYMDKLKAHVSAIEQQHSEQHDGAPYEKRSCILNYTEIVMDNMIYSVPASEVLDKTHGSVDTLEQAIKAMSQELELFYQHKGLIKSGTGAHRYPTQRLNIRYHKMFEGAFMYAGGKHIGIEFDSVDGLFGIQPITADENGTYIDGSLTGWGIAHEIGHIINNNKYAVAEITNNYYSILSTNNPRMNYDDVHKAVTGGKMSDSGLSLAMYWQLHMAYDPYDTYKIFNNQKDMMNNLFFARVDAYSRNPSEAPKNLKLAKNKFDNLVRLSCAAAQRNLLSFFDSWGVPYDNETAQYAKQFDEEDRKIQYLTPDANEYKINNGQGMDSSVNVNDSSLDYVSGENTVRLSLTHTGDHEDMLGYEIIRNGKPIAFVRADKSEYVDTITTGNNQVYTYGVIGYDKLLKPTETKTFEPIKVMHDGAIGRANWSVTTNMISDDDETVKPDGENGYCEETVISTIDRVIDDAGETYTGSTPDGQDAEIILDLGHKEQVTALKYQGDSVDFTISVSSDKQDWKEVKSGTFTDSSDTVFFDDASTRGYMAIYDAVYVKLTLHTDSASISDIDLLGPTNDNVELAENGIGKLKEDFHYGSDSGDFIPKGSLVFTGIYKGNPAYNVVLLRNQEGTIINGSQIILAKNPENGELGNVSDGTWVYWIEPEKISSDDLLDEMNAPMEKVMAELYRVDDAETNENSRLVSNTLYVDIPEDFKDLELTGGVIPKEDNESLPMIPIDKDSVIITPENEAEEALPITPSEPVSPDVELGEDGEMQEEDIVTPPARPDEDTPDVELPELPELQPEEELPMTESTESQSTKPETGLPELPELQPEEELPMTELTESQSVKPEVKLLKQTVQHSRPSQVKLAHEQEDTDNQESLVKTFATLGQKKTSFVGSSVAINGEFIRVAQVEEDEDGKPKFSFDLSSTKDKALMSLNLGSGTENQHDTIGFQTSFLVSEGVTDVELDWSDSLNDKALLKECRYDKDAKRVSIYVTATRNLVEDGVIQLGEIRMKTAESVSTASLEIRPKSTVVVSQDFESNMMDDVQGQVELNTQPVTSGGDTENPELPDNNEPQNPESPQIPDGENNEGQQKPDDNTGDTDKPDAGKPDTDKPDAGKPDTDKPDAGKPDTDKPDAGKPDTDKPDAGKPDTDKPIQPSRPHRPSGSSSHKKPSSDKKNESDKKKESDKKDEQAEQIQQIEVPELYDSVENTMYFDDVSQDSWYYESVNRAIQNGWFKGVSDTKFAPEQTMTRGMFVTVLGRFAVAPESVPTVKFVDVSASSYYAPYVAWALENGIVNGVSDTKFAPEQAVTREQLAVMVSKFIDATGIVLDETREGQTFMDDAQISSWAKESVSKMYRLGIVNGTPDGKFNPKGTATRAEVATILSNVEQKIPK